MTRIALALLVLAANTASGQVQSYRVDAPRSRITVAVGRSGLFSFAGHAHEVLAPSVTGGAMVDLHDLSRSEVTLSFQAADLQVTGRGDPPEDVPQVQAVMIGPKVLDVQRFPVITFRSDSVTARGSAAGAWDLEVVGDFSLHGATQQVSFPLRIQLDGDTLTASGTAVLRQSDFGIKPISVAGVVKVNDEVTITYRIVTRVR